MTLSLIVAASRNGVIGAGGKAYKNASLWDTSLSMNCPPKKRSLVSLVSLIVAASRNDVIGANNRLPWKLPADLKRFKQLTLGHPILMGRKTFESIGKPLPGRTNIVITHQKGFACCGSLTAGSLEEALRMCEEESGVFVIGGAQIFEQALPLADRIYLTRINQDFGGDTYLFEIDSKVWKETSREDFPADPLPHTFLIYEKFSS